jgi:hypothetical protein
MYKSNILKSYKYKLFLFIFLLFQLLFIFGCSQIPSDDFLKEAAIYSCFGGGSYGDYLLSEYNKNTIKLEKFKIKEKYKKKIDDENYTIYKFEISVNDNKTELTEHLSCSTAIIKRGFNWYYRLL